MSVNLASFPVSTASCFGMLERNCVVFAKKKHGLLQRAKNNKKTTTGNKTMLALTRNINLLLKRSIKYYCFRFHCYLFSSNTLHSQTFRHTGETIPVLLQASQASGQSSSLSLLVQRTIIRHTTLEKSIAKRHCHELFIGAWRKEKVLVKVYPPKHEMFYFVETEFYHVRTIHKSC